MRGDDSTVARPRPQRSAPKKEPPQASGCLKTSAALVPPKPKELEST